MSSLELEAPKLPISGKKSDDFTFDVDATRFGLELSEELSILGKKFIFVACCPDVSSPATSPNKEYKIPFFPNPKYFSFQQNPQETEKSLIYQSIINSSYSTRPTETQRKAQNFTTILSYSN